MTFALKGEGIAGLAQIIMSMGGCDFSQKCRQGGDVT